MNLTITRPQFERTKQQALIIDVRDNWEHQQLKKLPNSLNISFLELVSKPEKYIPNKDKLVITYCNYGNRSGQAAQILREKGYKAFVLEKGVEGYFSEKKNNNVIIGRHLSVSSPEFLVGAVKEAISYGANALALYVGSPYTSHRSHISELKPKEFKEFLKKDNSVNIKDIVVHAPYVMNLGNTLNLDKFQKSVKLLRTDIERMVTLGLETIVLHPGCSLSESRSKSISQIAQGINQVLVDNPPVRIALETMSGKGSEIGSNFEEMREIIRQIERKEKVGVCWDTCHLYNAGYDIKNNLEGVIQEFDQIVSLEKLWVIHLNDSVFDLGAKKDRHENIGYGKIGLPALKKIVHHFKFKEVIKILETPRKRENYKHEIKELIKF